MGARGELFTTQVYLDNRSYFFNVKENRTGDVFLQIVEIINRDRVEADSHQIAIFSDDMQQFLQGMEKSLDFVEKDRKERAKNRREKREAKDAKYGAGKKMYRVKSSKGEKSEKIDDGIKRTGKVIHIVSKKEISE